MKEGLARWFVAVAVLGCGVVLWVNFRGRTYLKPVDELRVRITQSTEIPDPAHIESTGDWYYLDHISSGLAFFDSVKKEFVPLLAESWSSEENNSHRFRIRQGIRFHDGTPITVKDILWTLKRQLILKTSTHFPLWEYIVGAENLHSLEDECDGLKAVSDNEILIRLKGPTESFFLQMASPETGIWAASDMDAKTAALHPTKFSGAYFVANRDENSALLKRNENSLISRQFPNSPRSIRIKKIPLPKLDDALLKCDVDLAIRLHNALGERDWKKSGIETRSTTASAIVYLFGLGNKERPAIGRDFMEAAWKINRDPVLTPSETFLPFGATFGITRAELLAQLPEHTAKKIKFFCPDGFYSKAFLDQLQEAAQMVGSKIEFMFAPVPEWFATFDDPKAGEKYDYMLSIYAASERYPAVQLRYLTGKFIQPTIDLKKAEVPDLNAEQIGILRDYQKWLLRARQAIPFYFTVTTSLYQKNIDIGEQPASDAEIELWRVQAKTP